MKKEIKKVCLALVLLCTLTSCEKGDISMKANGEANKFAAQVAAGLTTRAQEQAFIQEAADYCFQFDIMTRDSTKALETKTAAIASVKK